MNSTKLKYKILAQIRKNVSAKNWKCATENCSGTAINSHLLQRNGILNSIAEDGHLVELRIKDAFRWQNEHSPIEFKKVGIWSALSMPIFCSQCDSSLFKSIESQALNLFDYRTFVLLCYRVVCAEQRKKQQNVEIYERLLGAETLKGIIDSTKVELFLKGFKLGVDDLERLKHIVKMELENGQNIFEFATYTYPLIKVYGASLFSVVDRYDPDEMAMSLFDDVYIHVIPSTHELFILCGYLKEYKTNWIVEYTQSWANLTDENLKLKLSNLFAARIENWGMAPSLFNQIPVETMNKMIMFWNKHAMHIHRDLHVDFNLFE